MKRPARVPSHLPESVHRQLNAYALSACAAGVGALALAVPADAKIIYTPAHVVIAKGQKFQLDINHDGITDFALSNGSCGRFCTVYFNGFFIGGGSQNQIGITGNGQDGTGIAAALKKGATIPGNRSYFQDGALAAKFSFSYVGNWLPNVKNHYLGLTFDINKKKHYGWARVSVKTTQHPFTVTGTLTGYAFETIPNKPIIAGKTHGKSEATLGRLAQGASGVSNRGKP
jgi:hypothetical protein